METALIIGGTGGIGSWISKLFSEHGIKTYLTYHRNQKKAKEMAASLDNCEVLQCDVRKEADVRKAIESILQKEPKIDILVNSVTSGLKLKPFDSLTIDEISDDINTILLGSVNLYKHIIPVMKKQKSGLIINLLTSAIVDFPKRMSSYTAAKSGLFGLMKSLAAEFEPFNIRVVGISPYFVKTDLINGFPAKLLEMEKDKIVLPEDIARLALAISRDEKKYPTGTNVILRARKDILELTSKV